MHILVLSLNRSLPHTLLEFGHDSSYFAEADLCNERSRAWHGGAQVVEGVHNLQLRVIDGDDWGGLSTLRQDVGLLGADR